MQSVQWPRCEDTGTRIGQRAPFQWERTPFERQKAQLVRERDPDNRRLYRLRLTDEGHTLHARMRGTFQHRYARWVSAMTPAERAALLTGLPALLRAVHAVHR